MSRAAALIAALALAGLPATAQERGAALAPAAPLIGLAPIADGTAAPAIPVAAPSVTLPMEAAEDRGDGADDAATVLADRITLAPDRTLTAEGGVVVWYRGARLVAPRLTVDGGTGALTLDGPIHLSRPGSGTRDDLILIADAAQLDRTLQAGILRGARLVIARELQLAAVSAERWGGGRYITLDRVVASSCRICAGDSAPLWEVRARRITHDAQARSLILQAPQLRAFGVPIAAVPFTITAPDPTVERRSGLLRPQIRTTSGLGFGIKQPLFLTVGPSADLTLTPYLALNRTRTLEGRWRQAMATGALAIEGAVSRDDIRPGETRWYLFGAGAWTLPRDYRLGVQLQTTSDRAYLLDYGISKADRLWSGITLDRIRRDRLVAARIGHYDSLRADEVNATSPAQGADAIWQRRYAVPGLGGAAVLALSAHAHRRPSDANGAGRDGARLSAGLDWRRSGILPGGVVAAALAGLRADAYRVTGDTGFDRDTGRVLPYAGAELRWPLAGTMGGATHLVEPLLQWVYAPAHDPDAVPNEDSVLVEFDEGNVDAISRFPGWDRREQGARLTTALRWTRIDAAGWSLSATAGRVWRADPDPAFSAASPLAGRRSDWLLAATYDSGAGLALAGRMLIDGSGAVSRGEARLGVQRARAQLSAGYLWIAPDAAERRTVAVSEATAVAGWQLAPGWWASAEGRYDFAADRVRQAGVGVQFRNECLTVELDVSRRPPDGGVRGDTDVGLSVRLGGFGRDPGGPGSVARRSCLR